MPDPIQPCIMCAVLVAPDGTTELAVTAYDPATGRQRIKVVTTYANAETALAFIGDVVHQQQQRRLPAKPHPVTPRTAHP